MSLTVPQIRRLHKLSEAGLSDAAAAAVLRLDFRGLDVDKKVIRYYRRVYGIGARESWVGLAGMAKDASGNWGSR